MDLDGADCDAASAPLAWPSWAPFSLRFLRARRAKLVMEVFDGLVPPLRFALHEHQGMRWGELTVWGCSLSYQAWVRMGVHWT